jgi:hypothetical protein
MNEYEYNEHAWRRAVFEAVAEDIKKKYVKNELTKTPERIICPYLPMAVAEVPERVVHSVLNQIFLEATHYRLACETGRDADQGIARNREAIPSAAPTPNPTKTQPDESSSQVRKPKQARKKASNGGT